MRPGSSKLFGKAISDKQTIVTTQATVKELSFAQKLHFPVANKLTTDNVSSIRVAKGGRYVAPLARANHLYLLWRVQKQGQTASQTKPCIFELENEYHD